MCHLLYYLLQALSRGKLRFPPHTLLLLRGACTEHIPCCQKAHAARANTSNRDSPACTMWAHNNHCGDVEQCGKPHKRSRQRLNSVRRVVRCIFKCLHNIVFVRPHIVQEREVPAIFAAGSPTKRSGHGVTVSSRG